MDKFTTSKKSTTTMGKNQLVTMQYKCNSDKKLISYETVENLYKLFVAKNKDAQKMTILGTNRFRKLWTVKNAEDYEMTNADEYFKNKAKSSTDGFYMIEFQLIK